VNEAGNTRLALSWAVRNRLLMRGWATAMYDAIVVGTDGSTTATFAVRRAAELAATQPQSRLHLVSAYRPVSSGRLESERSEIPSDLGWKVSPSEDADKILERGKEIAAESGATDVRVHALDVPPADAILDVATDVGAGLIVVGNQGMTGAKRYLLGSVPNRIAHHADCDVLIVNTSSASRA
jgi:nucleotide-binding universal stress UspA family protein